MGFGVDPHLYKPSHGDLRKLQRADVVFASGLHLEGRLAEVLENLSRRKPVYRVTHDLEQHHSDRLRATATAAGSYDPHVWFDAALWSECAAYAGAELARQLPAAAAEIQENTRAYVQELQNLDVETRRRLAEIPATRRVLVTAHDAFAYFGRAYEVEVHGLQGISTADEADLRTMNALVDLLVARGIKAVFVESSVPAKQVESLVAGCRARGHQLKIGGELYSDALGRVGSGAETYAGMLRHNVETIVTALR